MKLLAVDHICVAVRDLKSARKRFEEDLGLEPVVEYTAPEEKINVIRYYVGEVAFELMEPTDEESEVAKFLKKRGEGVFLISFRVPDVEEALKELREKGVKTIDTQPRFLMGNRYAFIHNPKEMCGLLLEVLDGEFVFSPKKNEDQSGC
jgi:methylmalonyl-CoA/ethylmalonyl-CoA epimerase